MFGTLNTSGNFLKHEASDTQMYKTVQISNRMMHICVQGNQFVNLRGRVPRSNGSDMFVYDILAAFLLTYIQ